MTRNLQEVEEAQPLQSPEMLIPSGHEPQVCLPVMDEEDAAEDQYRKGYQEAARKAIDHWKGVFKALLIFKGDPGFALRCSIAAHGLWDLLPHRDQVEIAEHFKCERANVNKLTKLIQKRLGLPPTLGQRSVKGCENMSEKRKSQLQHVRD
jgi:hypothetical protein